MASTREHVGKAAAAGLSGAVGNYGAYAVTLIAQVALLRYLAPEDFGTYAVAVALVELIQVVCAAEFSTLALYRSSEENAFHTAIAGSWMWLIGLGTLALVVSEPLSRWFQPTTVRFIVILLAARLLFGVGAVYGAHLEKDYRFGRLAIIKGLARTFGSAVAVVCAVWELGAYSLLIGDLVYYVGATVVTIGSSTLSFRPSGVDLRMARDYVGLGMRQLLLRLSAVALSRGPVLALAAVGAGAERVGTLERALYVANVPNSVASHFNTKVAFILFRNLGDEPARMRTVLEMALWTVARLAIPVVVVLGLAGSGLLAAVGGENWGPAGRLLESLAPYAVGAVVLTLTTQVFVSQKQFTFVTGLQAAMTAAVWWAAWSTASLPFGEQSLAASLSAVYVLGTVALLSRLTRSGHVRLRLAFVVWGPIVACILAGRSVGAPAAGVIAGLLAAVATAAVLDFALFRDPLRRTLRCDRYSWSSSTRT